MFRQNYTILRKPGDETDTSIRSENCSEYRGKFRSKKVSKADWKQIEQDRINNKEQKRKHLDGKLQLFPVDKKSLSVKMGKEGKLRFETTRASDLRARANQPDEVKDGYWKMSKFEKIGSTGASMR